MISTCGSPPACLRAKRGFEDRLRLHAVQTGLEDAEAHSACAEHRVGLTPLLRGGEQHATFVVELAERVLHEQLLDVGEELVQRRVEQPDGDGQPVHRLEDALEVGALELGQLLERAAFSSASSAARMNRCTMRQAVAEEHVLGAAQPDAFGTESPCDQRVLGQVGVGAHLEHAQLVGPAEHGLEHPGELVGRERAAPRPMTTSPVVPLIEITSPWRTVTPFTVKLPPAMSMSSSCAPTHRGLAPSAGDQCRVTRQAAA